MASTSGLSSVLDGIYSLSLSICMSVGTDRDDVTGDSFQASSRDATAALLPAKEDLPRWLGQHVSRQKRNAPVTPTPASSTTNRNYAPAPANNPGTGLFNRSVCSWSYRINHDKRRLPVDIQVAVNCTNRLQDDERRVESRCEPIYFMVPVRVQVGTSGEAVSPSSSSSSPVTWVDQWVRLQVGCTLVTPQQQTPPPKLPVANPFRSL